MKVFYVRKRMKKKSDFLEEKEKYKNSMDVSSLINLLKKYPSNMKVFVTWESTINELKPEFIYEAETGSLYIDGEYAFYKDDFAKNPNENKEG